jgi:hypothetical protein
MLNILTTLHCHLLKKGVILHNKSENKRNETTTHPHGSVRAVMRRLCGADK